ncbi:unnamed protein product, partial [Prorocentrum cordatum]
MWMCGQCAKKTGTAYANFAYRAECRMCGSRAPKGVLEKLSQPVEHKYGADRTAWPQDQPQLLECAAIVDQAEAAKSTDGNLGVRQILMRLSDTERKLERAQGRIDAIKLEAAEVQKRLEEEEAILKGHRDKKKELEEARDRAQLREASARLQAIPAGEARGRAIRGGIAKTVTAGGLNEHTEPGLKAEVEAAAEVLAGLMERVAAQPPPQPSPAPAAAEAHAGAGAPAAAAGAADEPMAPAEEPVGPDPNDDEQEFWDSIGLGAAAAAAGPEGRADLLARRKRAWEAEDLELWTANTTAWSSVVRLLDWWVVDGGGRPPDVVCFQEHRLKLEGKCASA